MDKRYWGYRFYVAGSAVGCGLSTNIGMHWNNFAACFLAVSIIAAFAALDLLVDKIIDVLKYK